MENPTLRTEPASLFRVPDGPVVPAGSAEWLYARSGRRLRIARFEPAAGGRVRGSVVLSPGRTEPIEKYGEVAGDLVERGFCVLVHDWAGQGLSQRFQADALAGDVEGGWRALLADYADVVRVSAERLPRPWIAIGHSMGGALTALALTEVDVRFDGAVLCAPMMEFSVGKIPIRVAAAIVSVAVGIGFGARLVQKQVDPVDVPFERNILTHDRARYERMQALYRAHPELRIGEPTWRWLAFGMDLRARLSSPGTAERIACPVSIVAAGDDRIVHNGPIRAFCARIPNGQYVELPGASHEILMEKDEYRARFFEVFERMVTERLHNLAEPSATRRNPTLEA